MSRESVIATSSACRQYSRDTFNGGRTELILATAKIEDFDRFWGTFSTKGAEKRK
jgi:hypothetical protein